MKSKYQVKLAGRRTRAFKLGLGSNAIPTPVMDAVEYQRAHPQEQVEAVITIRGDGHGPMQMDVEEPDANLSDPIDLQEVDAKGFAHPWEGPEDA